jgi:hypothetical protein
MKFAMKLLLAAALLLTTNLARADQTWGPFTGGYLSDGGNDPNTPTGPYGGPESLLKTGGHGIRSTSPYTMALVTYGATWGTVNNSIIPVGTDSDFTIDFYSGTGAASVAGATIFTINFGQVWGNNSLTIPDGGAVPMFGGICYYLGPAAGTPGVSGFNLLPTSTTTATVISTTGFTPASATNYHFGCHVFNYGSPF